MVRKLVPVLLVAGVVAGPGVWSVSGAARPVTQTLVFDAVSTGRFVDKAPGGPSRGDTELFSAKLFDAHDHFVGTARIKCVFTKRTANDMLERCASTAKTAEGTVSLSGVGHLNSMNPPWRVTGRSGAYRGAHGEQVFATDIPLDPGVPLAAGRSFSVAVIRATASHPLEVGVVPRPAVNAGFIRRADALCRAAEARAQRLPGFPFSNFDPFAPDPQLLPQVGRFFSEPARHALAPTLLRRLERLGRPPAERRAWGNVLTARRALVANEGRQVKAALDVDVPEFVKTVYEQSRDFNRLVFKAAVFGVESCTLG